MSLGVSLDGVLCLCKYTVRVCNPGLTPQRLESLSIENRLRQILCIITIIIVGVVSETMEGGCFYVPLHLFVYSVRHCITAAP